MRGVHMAVSGAARVGPTEHDVETGHVGLSACSALFLYNDYLFLNIKIVVRVRSGAGKTQ